MFMTNYEIVYGKSTEIPSTYNDISVTQNLKTDSADIKANSQSKGAKGLFDAASSVRRYVGDKTGQFADYMKTEDVAQKKDIFVSETKSASANAGNFLAAILNKIKIYFGFMEDDDLYDVDESEYNDYDNITEDVAQKKDIFVSETKSAAANVGNFLAAILNKIKIYFGFMEDDDLYAVVEFKYNDYDNINYADTRFNRIDYENNYEYSERKNSNVLYLLLIIIFLLLLLLFEIITYIIPAFVDNNKNTAQHTSTGNTEPTSSFTYVTSALSETSEQTTLIITTTSANKSDFKLDKYSFEFAVGETLMPRVLEHPEGSGEWNEMWSSSDENIATVDQYGNIKAVAPGSCQIILRDGGDQTQEVQIDITVIGDTNSNVSANSPLTDAVNRALQQYFTSKSGNDPLDPEPKYFLFDVNNDGIDELFISYRTLISKATDLYLFKNGEYINSHYFCEGAKICPSDNLLQENAYGGGELTKIYCIHGDEVLQKDELLHICDGEKYSHNDMTITKNEYEQLLAQYEIIDWIYVPDISIPFP